MGIESLSLVVAAFVSLSLGTAALMRNFRSRTCVAFATACAALFVHDVLKMALLFGSFESPRLYPFITFLLAPAILWWLKTVVGKFDRILNRTLIFYFFVLGVLALLMAFSDYMRVAFTVSQVSEVCLLPVVLVGVIALREAEKSSVLTREKLRYRYAVWGGALTTAAYLTDSLYFNGLLNIVPVGTVVRAIYCMFLFQLFIQKQLITAEELLTKISLFGGLALILSGIFSLLLSWVGNQPRLFFFNTLITSFVILVLFEPTRTFLSKLSRRVFLKKQTQIENQLQILGDSLRGVVEPLDMVRNVRAVFLRGLGIHSTAFYVLDRDGISFVRLNSDKFPEELSSSSPLAEYMALRKGRPFVLETVQTDRDSFRSQSGKRFCEACLENLRHLGVDFVVPIVSEGKPIGFLCAALGDQTIFSNEQLRLFAPLSKQMTGILKNAQILNSLRNRDKLAVVGEMAAGLAHEIRNPLGAIKGAAELLSEEKDEKVCGEYTQIIRDEADRLSRILGEFLDYAKPREQMEAVASDPLQVIEAASTLALRDSKVKLEVHADNPELRWEMDPEILKQVLLNLFMNSAQAMNNQGGKIEVVVREIKPKKRWLIPDAVPLFKTLEGWKPMGDFLGKNYLEIQVRDSGPGIDAKEYARVFTPFYTTKTYGTGLGLSICQRLVEGLGGTIEAKPNQPHGVVFTVRLPRKTTAMESREAPWAPQWGIT